MHVFHPHPHTKTLAASAALVEIAKRATFASGRSAHQNRGMEPKDKLKRPKRMKVGSVAYERYKAALNAAASKHSGKTRIELIVELERTREKLKQRKPVEHAASAYIDGKDEIEAALREYEASEPTMRTIKELREYIASSNMIPPLAIMIAATNRMLKIAGPIAAFTYAKECAPYLHSKMQTTTLQGPGATPLVPPAFNIRFIDPPPQITQRETNNEVVDVVAKEKVEAGTDGRDS